MTAPDATNAAPEKASLIEDFIDILFTPAKVFARRANGSWAAFFIVAILLIVLIFVNSGAMSGMMEAEANRAVAAAVEKNPEMTEDQLNAMRSVMEVSMKWAPVIFMPVMLLGLGLLVMIVGKVLGATIGFGLGVMIASYAYVPKVIEMMGVAIQALLLDASSFTGRYSYSLGVGRFMDSSGKQGLYGLLGRIDLFTIWVTVLLVIGLMHAAKMPRDKAIIAGVILWMIGAVMPLFQIATGS